LYEGEVHNNNCDDDYKTETSTACTSLRAAVSVLAMQQSPFYVDRVGLGLVALMVLLLLSGDEKVPPEDGDSIQSPIGRACKKKTG
jgi:hypothetical protein